MVGNVLLDLDGTLTDPKPGIVRSIQYALRALACDCPEEDALEWCIGPPLQSYFPVLLQTDDPVLIARAIALYRERFAEIGLFENTVYKGVPEALVELRSNGLRQFLATSKPIVFATRILDHFGLGELLDGVYGQRVGWNPFQQSGPARALIDSRKTLAR